MLECLCPWQGSYCKILLLFANDKLMKTLFHLTRCYCNRNKQMLKYGHLASSCQMKSLTVLLIFSLRGRCCAQGRGKVQNRLPDRIWTHEQRYPTGALSTNRATQELLTSELHTVQQHNEVKLIWWELTFWWRLLRSMGLLWLWLGRLLLLLLLLLLWMMVVLCLWLLKVLLSWGRLSWRLCYFLFDFRLFFWRFIILIHSWAFLFPLTGFFRFNLTKKQQIYSHHNSFKLVNHPTPTSQWEL